MRQETGNSKTRTREERQEAGDRRRKAERLETRNRRWETGNRETGDRKWETGSRRQETLDRIQEKQEKGDERAFSTQMEK